jgi:hypothetical protein
LEISLEIVMGYNIEISMDLLKHNNISETKREIIDFALDLDCSYYYYLYEYEDRIKFPRNHVIIVINFGNDNDSNLFNCAKFLRTIKKMKDLHIESIYEDDDVLCKLIYASAYYLKNVEKDKAIKYSKYKKERSYSDDEKLLLSFTEKLQV